MTKLTVVMPAYNEEDCIRDAVSEVVREVLDGVEDSCLIVVNDGSRDSTGDMLDELAATDPRIRVLHKRNGGHGDSLAAGADSASSAYLLLVDSDCQVPLNSFLRHWEMRSGHVLVCGVRQNRQDALHRLLITRVMRAVNWVLFGRYLRDANVPYKIVPRDLWIAARRVMPDKPLTPSLLLTVFAASMPGHELVEVPVRHLPRRSGKVSLVSWKLCLFCILALGQLVEFRMRLRR